jgi:hypothetical protein
MATARMQAADTVLPQPLRCLGVVMIVSLAVPMARIRTFDLRPDTQPKEDTILLAMNLRVTDC